ncbi:7-carboxy-7-deazaguanine synthase [Modicisalibacter luteus]|uniref:7-carboxy-7-deazaguanine synthase n=1 Tax=Modicisalibacter luteus TaxID=453962 RepID=A0ABV7M2I7_9GAMM|nr:7-carboxy-7-deazaguanine synthase [Halomonas lutea]GHA84163.1 7-carboxy-7-deazaguanine synthase [Halomonas lutea]
MYSVKEAFYSLQGEGARAGRASVFCRFSGCNLWSGRERDRATSVCRFCDTDFVGINGQNGGRFATADELSSHLASLWPTSTLETSKPYVVFTGGEPLLQLDSSLLMAMHDRGFEVAVETNGTLQPPVGIDWICVSPKGRAPLRLTQGNELKLVYPQADARPEQFTDLAFDHFFLQPMELDFQGSKGNTLTETVSYCLSHPQWRLSVQIHKLAGID